jgi:1-phosphofructokinase family hexose kinase
MKILTVTLHPAIDRIISTPHLATGEPNPSKLIKVYAAGKGVNAARALHRLGIPVFALTFGGGDLGDFYKANLNHEGIPASIICCRAPMRITTVLIEERTGKRFTFYEPRQVVTKGEASAMLEHFSSIVGEFDLCLLCGAGDGPVLEKQFQKMIEQARKIGVPCLLDSSGASLNNGIQAKPLLVKVNRLELAAWAKKDFTSFSEQIAALRTILQWGVEVAAVSDQRKGMVVSNGENAWQGKYVPEKVINTLGCGDAALAGMAYALSQNKTIREVVRFGVAYGAANTQNFGAGFLLNKTVREYLSDVKLRSLKS